ncbi:tumorhead S homeolog isoform X1 [Pelobates cultripes]|uniref:Tumorhead S homeolog isoform X1 n=1 Tax=Pelobates cultripes TaxID=61616 RepID=A0AAD1T7L7_PELCU|nr:tumorhead S homeolog isoform X1 [Pelobates cultripes]
MAKQSMEDLSDLMIKKRKKKFSDKEDQVLVKEILSHVEQLYGPNASNSLRKTVIWQNIVTKINKEGGTNRTLMDCKKRWSDYKRKIRRVLTEKAPDVNMEKILNSTQLRVAKFFRMDQENESDTRKSGNVIPDNEGKSLTAYVLSYLLPYPYHNPTPNPTLPYPYL